MVGQLIQRSYKYTEAVLGSGVPEDVDARAIIKEFIAFVEADIV